MVIAEGRASPEISLIGSFNRRKKRGEIGERTGSFGVTTTVGFRFLQVREADCIDLKALTYFVRSGRVVGGVVVDRTGLPSLFSGNFSGFSVFLLWSPSLCAKVAEMS
jgi:hypothetical protein